MSKERCPENNKRVIRMYASDKDELGRLYDFDERKFRENHSSDINNTNQAQLAAKLVFSSHSLEKSLSNDNFESGHGFRTAKLLIDILRVYKENNYDQNHLAYISTLSVLRAFYERHKDTARTREIETIFNEFIEEIIYCKSKIGGSDTVLYKSKKNNDQKNFKDLAKGRFAIRTYATKPVSKNLIRDAVDIATKTPTVCNRQSIKVRVIYEKSIIQRVLEVQGGLEYYDTPPVLLLVTADDNGYMGANERNQGFIDGGLFAMSLLYALEYKKLAACPAHAMLTEIGEIQIRGMLGLYDSEKLITFITAGHFKKENNICKSFRYPVDQILSEVNKLHDFTIETVDNRQPTINENRIYKIRRKIRPRTRIKSILLKIKHTTRIRTRLKQLASGAGAYLDGRHYGKADGAILTLTGYFNYGNILQRYALQKFLLKNGYSFISYVDQFSAPRDLYRISKRIKITIPLRAIKRFFKYQKPFWHIPNYGEIYPDCYGSENLIHFVNKNIWIKPFDPDDKYDNYIVGSDQIWRNWWGENRSALGYYFLDFLKDSKAKRIAYAASFGKEEVQQVMTTDDSKYVRPYIEQFNSISVREKSAINQIKKIWNITGVVRVVDPTLLLTKEEYSKLIDSSVSKNEIVEPIFAYILDGNQEINDFIERVSKIKKHNVTEIRAHHNDPKYRLPKVEYWLKCFRDSSFVITNSFHGMIFSIINNKEFIVISRDDGGLARIKDFLKEYAIEDRLIMEKYLKKVNLKNIKPIDWNAIQNRIDDDIESSKAWLIESIEQ